jgi:hypothetical protein
VIIVYAGPTAQPTASAAPPYSADLAKRLRGLIQSLNPACLVGGLATEADLLFVRTALAERRTVHVVLPVNDAGVRPAMSADHERILGNPRVTVVEQGPHHSVDARILDEAGALADAGSTTSWLITIRDGSTGTVADLVQCAEERGMLTLGLSPERRPLRAFVLMPFGGKRDVESGTEVDCDPPFHKVYRPLLEDADLDWSRADLETDTGIIHPSMLEHLANCDVAIADLTTTNFNVAYELGVRHVFAPRSTVLVSTRIAEIGARRPPFDVAMSRVHQFDRGLVLTDSQAEAAIRQLRPVLQQAVATTAMDSPAHKWFEMERMPRPLLLREEVRDHEERLAKARQRVAEAVRSADRELMRDEAGWLEQAPDLPEPLRRALRMELAWALLGESAYRDARELFDLSRPPLDDPLHRTWLQRSVMAYRRSGEVETDPDRRMEYVHKAQTLLAAAVDAGYGDSETYGIWGGLIKREIAASGRPLRDPVTQALFRDMAEKYREGFERDPSYYTGVNLVLALRLAIRERDETSAAELQETIAATKLFTRRALKADPADCWAAFTMAELALHDALERGADLGPAVDLYAKAALRASPDQRTSARFQLEFLQKYGERAEALTTVLAVLDDLPG